VKRHRRGNEQGPAATSGRGTRNGGAPYSPAVTGRTARRSLAGVQGAQGTARQGGASGTEAASLPLTLRHGMEARQGGDSLAGSVHDSPPGRPLQDLK